MDIATERIDTLQSIELAEGVEVRLRIAGPFLRGSAFAIDIAIQASVLAVVMLLLAIANINTGSAISSGMESLFLFAMMWWYPVFFEYGKWGATPGKRAMGLRVVQISGSPLTFGQSVIRNFLRCVDHLPPVWSVGGFPVPSMIFGVASCVATRRFQRLGDLAAGTVVIYEKVVPEPAFPVSADPEAEMPPARLLPDEVRALASFRSRAGFWSAARRAEIGDHASDLSGATGEAGVSRLVRMAQWLQEKR